MDSSHRRTLLLGATVFLLLGGCSDGSHAVCKDAASTQQYAQKFTTDVLASAGKLTPDVLRKIDTEFQGLSMASGDDYAGFCKKLDDIRKNYGI